jgi:hypothetical protein
MTKTKKSTTPPPELRFQPRYASTHSVFAQQKSMKSEKKLTSSRLEMHQKLAPQRRGIIKDFNRIVDTHLRQVVEKINVKQELEKQQRQLHTKAQKRHDEVNSLLMQRRYLEEQIEKEKPVAHQIR